VTVDISATFTKKEQVRNGLSHIAKDLTEHPNDTWVVVGVIECIRTVTDHTSGDAQTPVVKFLHIEAMHGDAAATARGLLQKAYEARTGRGDQDPLPFEDTGDDDDE
jgi:hypothetical protein